MNASNFTEQEIRCIRFLAAVYNSGQRFISNPYEVMHNKGLVGDHQTYVALMGMMEQQGVIQGTNASAIQKYGAFSLLPKSVELARAIELTEKDAKQPKDIVSQVIENSRKNPLVAWILIIVIVLGGTMTFVNQATDFLTRIGVIPTAKTK
jgi:hypothetical protein